MRKQWTGADHPATLHDRRHAGDQHRDEAAGLPFKQQQLHRQQHRGDRGAEHRRHAGCRACHQHGLALGRAQIEALREQRAERPAGHDDRAFRAERTAGADRDCRGQRFEQGDLGIDPATADQDCLDRLRDAVAANFLRPVAGHEADDHRPGHRDQNRPVAKPIEGDRPWPHGQFSMIGDVGDQRDEPQQDPGRANPEAARHNCHRAEDEYARMCRVVAEFLSTGARGDVLRHLFEFLWAGRLGGLAHISHYDINARG